MADLVHYEKTRPDDLNFLRQMIKVIWKKFGQRNYTQKYLISHI